MVQPVLQAVDRVVRAANRVDPAVGRPVLAATRLADSPAANPVAAVFRAAVVSPVAAREADSLAAVRAGPAVAGAEAKSEGEEAGQRL